MEFTEDGHLYRSAEHYMMAHKAWLFGDADTATKILNASHPGEAKKLGRAVRGFDDQVWTGHRYEIVVRGSTAKFGGASRDFLLATHGRVLVEASPVDRIWGIGKDDRAASPSTWPGLNLLGFALMTARDILRLPSASRP
ncbi:NADAR family protein [Nonomuraea sp. NPDC046570]|uniref:NADAR family protein n=1 Tax=Nonomuraea sp. NPDC046570 TaxID=3155255 RepID=UPI003409B7B6